MAPPACPRSAPEAQSLLLVPPLPRINGLPRTSKDLPGLWPITHLQGRGAGLAWGPISPGTPNNASGGHGSLGTAFFLPRAPWNLLLLVEAQDKPIPCSYSFFASTGLSSEAQGLDTGWGVWGAGGLRCEFASLLLSRWLPYCPHGVGWGERRAVGSRGDGKKLQVSCPWASSTHRLRPCRK